MDTSEIYVLMCLCFEIQGQWKPKEGDCFSFVGNIHILSDYETWALEKRELSDIDCWNEVITLMGGHFVDHWNECREGFVWLPRQDQIQEMMNHDKVEYCLRLTDIGWIGEIINMVGEVMFCPNRKSFEQLWLAFYMYEKHGKVWDGEKWEKK